MYVEQVRRKDTVLSDSVAALQGAYATVDEPPPLQTPPIQTGHEICIATARTCRPHIPCLPRTPLAPSHQRLEPPLVGFLS